ncbi:MULTISPECIES: helix-turn-helix domain-containing protein [unclassified Nonomuraea]|uniref:helix-turn-helix domain-containing protein n=1 Tax=unclassified Nonomuraea TaxID=2593643 RepID=UPI0035C02460
MTAIRVVFDADEHPDEGERFSRFQDAMAKLPVPVGVSGEPRTDFWARVRVGDLGAVTVTSLATRTGTPYRIERTPAHIRRGDPGAYQLILHRSGRPRAGTPAVPGPSHLALYDTSQPFRREPGGGPAGCVMMTFSRGLLPVPAQVVRPVVGVPLGTAAGVGALVAEGVGRIGDDLDRNRPGTAHRLSGLVVDLLATLVAHELAARPPARSKETLLLQIQSFILRHLGDPTLSPRSIAAANHISIRSLHRLFSGHGHSVCDWIRDQRLERCRRDLGDPLLAGHPVHAIAARWGLDNPAHFSQLFRSTYKVNPTAYRTRALRPS